MTFDDSIEWPLSIGEPIYHRRYGFTREENTAWVLACCALLRFRRPS